MNKKPKPKPKKEPTPREQRAIIARPGKGKKSRDWGLIKSRFMLYEWLTYSDIAKATGIPLEQIKKRACLTEESWTQERTRLTLEAESLAWEEARAQLAKGMKARIQNMLGRADLLQARGLERLGTTGMTLDSREAIAALAETRKIEEAVMFKNRRQAGADDDDEETTPGGLPDGVVLIPVKKTPDGWGPSKGGKKP